MTKSGKTKPSKKVQMIWALAFLVFALWLFYDRADIVFNADLKDGKIVGCDTKSQKMRSSSATTSRNVTVYMPIAVTPAGDKAVGTFWLREKEWCEDRIGADVQIYVHKTDSSKNRINSFLQFWFYAYFVGLALLVFLLFRSSGKATVLLTILALLYAAYMAERETGFLFPVSQKPGEEQDVDLSELALRQCVVEAMDKKGAVSRSNLPYLLCQDSGISDLSSISDLSNLEELYLQGNKLTSLETLPPLTKLRIISVAGNKTLVSLKGIVNAPNIEELQANKSALSDLTGLEQLDNLKVVGLMQNKITDVRAFSNLTLLEDVTLSHNQITDISAFSSKPYLKDLQFYGNMVKDITPLYGNDALKIVGVRGEGNVPCSQILSLRQRLPEAKIWGQKSCD